MKLQIRLLEDCSRLPELYEFRVRAWENSPSKNMVNRTLFPNGLFDAADERSLIWYMTNEQDEFIATARLTYLYHPQQFDEIRLDPNNLAIPPVRPIGLFSKLAVDSNFRGRGIARRLDQIRIQQLQADGIPFALGTVNNKRMPRLESLGFRRIGIMDAQPSPKGAKGITNLMLLETPMPSVEGALFGK